MLQISVCEDVSVSLFVSMCEKNDLLRLTLGFRYLLS